MLADGFLERVKPGHNTRLRVDHAYPEQESYVLSIHTLFSPLIGIEPTISERKPDPRTGKVYKSMYFRTLSFSSSGRLNIFHDLFYKDKIKVVPLNIGELLTKDSSLNYGGGMGYFYQIDLLLFYVQKFLPKRS